MSEESDLGRKREKKREREKEIRLSLSDGRVFGTKRICLESYGVIFLGLEMIGREKIVLAEILLRDPSYNGQI